MDAHDNRTDVRINNRINVYGNVFFIGSISLVSVGFCFFGIFITNFWGTAVMLSAILVYSLMALIGLTLLGLVGALWIKFVISPGAEAYERMITSRGQEWRNRLIHAQENAVVIAQVGGTLEVVPLLPAPVVEAETVEEPEADRKTVIELYEEGLPLKTICERTNCTYYKVQKWTSEYEAKRAKSRQWAGD